MKRIYEFEVIIPRSAFRHAVPVAVDDLLNYFCVHFDLKGASDDNVEYLVTAPSYDLARAVREMLFNLSRVVVLSGNSSFDKQRSKSWLFGIIREVESE